MKLADKKCIPCEDSSIAPLSCDEALKLMDEYSNELNNWIMSDDCKKISIVCILPDFVTAMQFVNKIADIAESLGHHPDITIQYSRVELNVWTHSIKGLSENDFILAAKINEIDKTK